MSSGAGFRSPGARWRELGAWLRGESVLLEAGVRQELLERWEAVADLERALEGSLLVGLVGGTGAGKSTCLNALAGVEVSPTGGRRPTTGRAVVYRHEETVLPAGLPRWPLAEPQVCHRHEALRHVTVLDFPDHDSLEAGSAGLLEECLPHLDVLLVVADPERYADESLHALLAGLGQSPANVHVLLNKADRLESRYGRRWRPVAEAILADFREKLARHAGLEVERSRSHVISALRAWEGGRHGAAGSAARESPGDGGFEAVREALESFREAKRRRLAREANLEARRQAVCRAARDRVLAAAPPGSLERALAAVVEERRRLERALARLSGFLLEAREERRLALAEARRARGLVLSLLPGLRAQPGGHGLPPVKTLAARVEEHAARWIARASHLPARLRAELAGVPWVARLEVAGRGAAGPSAAEWRWALAVAARALRILAAGEDPPGRPLRLAVRAVPLLGALPGALYLVESTAGGLVLAALGAGAGCAGVAAWSLWKAARRVRSRRRAAEASVREEVRRRAGELLASLERQVASALEEARRVEALAAAVLEAG